MKYRKPTYRLRWQKLLLGCLLFLLGGGSLAAQGISYRAQSLYLYKFTRYVTWPQPVMEKDTLSIGVYGRSPIESELRLMASLKRAAGNRPIAIRPVGGLSELQAMLESKTFGLQILYEGRRMGWSKEWRVQIREWRRGREVRMPIDEVRRRKWLPYPSGGRAFSYCSGAACGDDLAEQGQKKFLPSFEWAGVKSGKGEGEAPCWGQSPCQQKRPPQIEEAFFYSNVLRSC
jgi:hypothetical protein